jgi:SAM-dependent methyltransferase
MENGYTAVRCRRCGLVYVTPRPSPADMKQLYDGQETRVDVSAHLRLRDLKCAQARRSLLTIAKFQREGSLLEVGSAAGYLLWEAKKAGYDVQGLDVTRAFVEFSRAQLGIPTHEGTLGDAPFADGSFDVVYMRNVLSHLTSPRQEHDRIHGLLRPGGFLIFETGNVAELSAERAGALELPDHLYHFHEASIRKLLAMTGFAVREIRRFGLVAHLPIVRFFKSASDARVERDQSPAALCSGLPRSSWLRRLEARAGTSLRYDVGRFMAGRGRRCTLEVVAQRI